MEESLQLLQSTCESPSFSNDIPIFLIFNKIDIFVSKFNIDAMRSCFQDIPSHYGNVVFFGREPNSYVATNLSCLKPHASLVAHSSSTISNLDSSLLCCMCVSALCWFLFESICCAETSRQCLDFIVHKFCSVIPLRFQRVFTVIMNALDQAEVEGFVCRFLLAVISWVCSHFPLRFLRVLGDRNHRVNDAWGDVLPFGRHSTLWQRVPQGRGSVFARIPSSSSWTGSWF